MFSGYWLVADVDGTLTPTPTRAGGKYYSLSQSARIFGPHYRSCLPALRQFILCGGSLCAVSTAGRRLWAQLYDDLAPSLFPASAHVQKHQEEEKEELHQNNMKCDSTEVQTPGRLLICGFSGAVLFRSRDPATVYAAMQNHVNSHSKLNDGEVAEDVSCVPPASLGMEEWTSYHDEAITIQQASTSQQQQQGTLSSSPHDKTVVSMLSRPMCTTLDEATRAAAAAEGRAALIRFLEHASYVSGHDVTRAETFFQACLSRKYHRVYTDLLRDVLHDITAHTNTNGSASIAPGTHLCFAHAAPLRMEYLAQHGYYLRETNDALVDCQVVPQADGTVRGTSLTAQIIIMGIPSAYFSAVFPRTKTPSSVSTVNTTSKVMKCECCSHCAKGATGAMERLEALGLQVKSQPNSVCLHRHDVDKRTCLTWLCAHREQLGFELSKALAFADTPSSVDRPLLHFPPMRFISVSPNVCSSTFDETKNFTPEERANMYYVGGQEEGTACFLDALLRRCTEAYAKKKGETSEVTSSLFSEPCVRACAEEARHFIAQHVPPT